MSCCVLMAIFYWFSSFRDIAILWWHWYIFIYPFIIANIIKFNIREVTKSRKETLSFISQCLWYRPKLKHRIWNLEHCVSAPLLVLPARESCTFPKAAVNFTLFYIFHINVHDFTLCCTFFFFIRAVFSTKQGFLHFSCRQFSCQSSEWTFFLQR